MQSLKIIKTPGYVNKVKVHNCLKFDCYDKNLHLRLKDYKWNDIITGTINKVSFLLSYYFSYIRLSARCKQLDFSGESLLDSLKQELYLKEANKDEFDSLKTRLMSTDVGDIKLVLDSVIKHFDIENITILPVYRKIEIKDSTCFGNDATLDIFKQISVGYNEELNTISYRWNIISEFLDYLGLTLDEFLYDDSIELILDTEDRNKSAYKKYFNKKTQAIKKKLLK